MPNTESLYSDEFASLELIFDTPSLSMREVGLILLSVDYMLNKTALIIAGFPFVEDFLPAERGVFRIIGNPTIYPAVVTAEIDIIAFGSVTVKTKIRTARILRDIGIGTTGSLIATGLIYAMSKVTISEHQARQTHITVINSPPPPPTPIVDVGPNVNSMVQSLSSSGQSWELTIKKTDENQQVIIKGNQSQEHHPHRRMKHK